MAESFFDRPSTSGPAVDMATAATAASHPMTPPAEVNESFFGEAEAKAKKAPDPPPAAAPPDPNMLQTMQALNQNLQQQNQVMQQMAAGSDPRAQVAAMAQFEQARQNQQQYVQQFAPPKIDDVDDLVTDGEAIKDFVEKTSSWALQVARAEYAPVMQQMQTITALAEPVLQDARDRAWEKTEGQLRDRGFQEEMMPQLRQLTEQIAQRSYQDWNEQQKFLMNADAMRYSAEAGYEQMGGKMPLRGEGPPVNAPQSRGGQGSGGQSESPMMQQVAERLGIPISPETHQKFRDFQRSNA